MPLGTPALTWHCVPPSLPRLVLCPSLSLFLFPLLQGGMASIPAEWREKTSAYAAAEALVDKLLAAA